MNRKGGGVLEWGWRWSSGLSEVGSTKGERFNKLKRVTWWMADEVEKKSWMEAVSSEDESKSVGFS